MKSKCKICGKDIENNDRLYHIFDFHVGVFLEFVENKYLAKLLRKAVLRCYE